MADFISLHTRHSAQGYCPPLRIQMYQSHYFEEALQIAFSYMDYASLRKCMLVSKIWRKLAFDELELRCFVNISCENHAQFILKQLHGSHNFRVGKCIIYRTISLDSLVLQQMFSTVKNTLHFLKLETASIEESILFKLLNKLPNLTHLSVTDSLASSKGISYHSNANNSNFRKFPILSGQEEEGDLIQNNFALENGSNTDYKRIDLKDAYTSQKRVEFLYENIFHLHLDFGSSVTIQLSKIFQIFPNLVELAVANTAEEPRKHFKFWGSQPHHHHGKLKHLSLRQYSQTSFSEKLVQSLIRLNMHIESLVLILHPPSKTLIATYSLIRQFIESLGGSLQSLKLAQVEDDLCHFSYSTSSHNYYRHAGKTGIPSGAPNSVGYYYWNFNYSSPPNSLLPIHLPNLEMLHVQKPLITNLAQVLNRHPALKELSLQVSCGSNWKGMLPSKLEPHAGITRLRIDFIDSESLSRLGYWFPALQTLQLSYCDKSLFDVLCNLIPYFNGGSNFVSCEHCHGSAEVFIVAKRKDETTARKDSGGENCKGSPRSGSGFTLNKNSNDGFSLELERHVPKKKFRFKNLLLLNVRPCEHRPFEKFVFLQGEHYLGNMGMLQDSLCSQRISYGGTIGGESTRKGFSWHDSDTMKDEFIDLPFDSTENECSSA